MQSLTIRQSPELSTALIREARRARRARALGMTALLLRFQPRQPEPQSTAEYVVPASRCGRSA